jgi:hypothetical protein
LLTPARNSSPVSMTPVSDTFTVLYFFTGVNDAAEELHQQYPPPSTPCGEVGY